jgi:acetoin utilization deacetylase AcuC-like enzyme
MSGSGRRQPVHTGFFTHAQCAAHEMGSWHPESPERLAAVHDHLIAVGLLPHLLPFDAPQAEHRGDRPRAHDRGYIEGCARGYQSRATRRSIPTRR